MKLFKRLEWPVFDIAVFKWTMFAFGLIAGAYFSGFVKSFIGIIAAAAAAGFMRVFYFYFIKNK